MDFYICKKGIYRTVLEAVCENLQGNLFHLMKFQLCHKAFKEKLVSEGHIFLSHGIDV